MTVREAQLLDNESLIALAKQTPIDGLISLRIDREPDYFRLLSLRGEGKVFVATVKGSIVGSISVAYRTVYLSGRETRIGYIGDLRVHPRYAGSRTTFNLLNSLHEYARSLNVDIYFCVMAKGNNKVHPLLKGRFNLPRFYSIGLFHVYQLFPLPFYAINSKYIIGRALPADFDELLKLLNNHNRNYDFSPYMSIEEFKREKAIISRDCACELIIAKENNIPVASISILDTATVKKNVAVKIPVYLQTILYTLDVLRIFLPIPPLPKIGDPVNLVYIRHLMSRTRDIRPLRSLISYVGRYAYNNNYSFVTVGFHERDPLRKTVRSMPKLTFLSEGYVTSLSGDEATINQIRDNIPSEDFSLV